MFCSKCGTQIPDDTKFCSKCGTEVVYKATEDTNIDGASNASTELIVSIAKVDDNRALKWKFPLFIDNIPIDELSNGQEATYKIQPGEHCVQIGFKNASSVRIWIRATRDNSPINLNYIWGVNMKRDIVCLQSQVVTKLSERDSLKSLPRISKIGLACFGLGLVGIFLSYSVMPNNSGSVVSAESHAAAMAALPSVMGICIGAFVCMFIGAILLNLPTWLNKKEFKKILQNRKSTR